LRRRRHSFAVSRKVESISASAGSESFPRRGVHPRTAQNSVAGARLPAPEPREDSVKPAQYFVVQSGGEWRIKFRNQMFGPYRSRDEALLFAIDAARDIGARESAAQVLVEDMKDHFLTRWTYGTPARLPAA
jgi:hypothetical protein